MANFAKDAPALYVTYSHMMNNYLKTSSILALSLGAIACSEREEASTDPESLTVYTTNYPLMYFTQRILGEGGDVRFPEIDGDPAFWTPSDAQLVALQQADRIVLNGAGYEPWLERVSLSVSQLVDTSEGFKKQLIYVDDAVTHSHGPDGSHSHGTTAFTTWLDLELAVAQAAAIDAALDVEPSGFQSLKTDLLDLDARLEKAFSRLKGVSIVGSHPVYQYLAEAYGLDMTSVHWEPDTEPSQVGWAELAHIKAHHGAQLMLWEDAPLDSVVSKLDALGIASVVWNPTSNLPEAGDFLSVMESNLEGLEAYLDANAL